MSASKPVFLFVPGAFQGPPHFEPIVQALKLRGFDAIALAFSGVGEDAATAPELESVQYVRSKVQELTVGQKRDVILVGCSYGGFVASMSVKGLEKRGKSQEGGVKRIIFISALLIPEKGTMVASLGGALPAWAELDKKEGILNPAAECAGLFYSDLDKGDQEHWATFFKPVSPRDSVAVVRDSCWDVAVPKTYIYTTNDRTHSYEAQQAMVKRVISPRTDDWTFETMHSDHSPFLSHVEDLAAILGKLTA